MKIVSTSYSKISEFDNPQHWLERISFYTGILEELARKYEVVSIERINYKGSLHHNGVKYYFIHLNGTVVLFPWRMHWLIKKQQPDVVLVQGFIFPLQIIQLRWAIGKKAKIIVQNHAEKPSSGIKKFFQRMADHYISAYLFTSYEMGMEWVEKGIIANGEKIVEVMEASSSFSVIGKKAGDAIIKTSNVPVFLWVGRFNANKDPGTVVKAFICFLGFQPSAKLYMIYQTEELLQEVTDLIRMDDNARSAITLLGKIPHQQLEKWYNAADFFISGSHYEGSGIAVCEAMSCGCIPVITNIVSFRKMTGYGKCGLLYEPGNDRALLNVLLQTQKMDIRKEQDKVLQQFKEELSFEAIAREIDKAIAGL